MSGASGFSPIQATLSGDRRHFQQGPIDLVLKAYGSEEEVRQAYVQGWKAFEPLLTDLVADLKQLRKPVPEIDGQFASLTAEHMRRAVEKHGDVFVTPMAAVAGAVADTVLSAMVKGRSLEKAYVNNGGDIALYLSADAELSTGIVTNVDAPMLDGFAAIASDMPVRGIATSGWRGRSLSRGIADSVTVLAKNAASADVAATLIANAVTAEHPEIKKTPASELDPDSDLGNRLVTVEVPVLPSTSIDEALDAGVAEAQKMTKRNLIEAVLISLQGEMRTVGGMTNASAIQNKSTTLLGRKAA